MAYYTNYFNQYLTVYFVLTLMLIKIIEMYYGMIKVPVHLGVNRNRLYENDNVKGIE